MPTDRSSFIIHTSVIHRVTCAPVQLANIIIIGNSFAYYEENAMGQDLYETAPYLARACKTVTETPVPNSVDPHAAFNNTSVHYFDQRGIMQTVQAEPTQTGGPAREPS